MVISESSRVWTIPEAKAKLSEILRLAETEGPQRIGARKSFIVVPADIWEKQNTQSEHLGRWMIENLPGTNFPIPERTSYTHREIPFTDWTDEDWDDR